MKKIFLILLIVLVAALCASLIGCGLFGKPNGPDNTDGDETVYKLEELQIGAQTFTFDYDGQPKTFDVSLSKNGKLVAEIKAGESHPDLEVSFRNNVEIGAGEVVVKAKSGSKKFSGQVKADFEIRPVGKTVYAADFAELKQYLGANVYSNVELSAEVTIPENEKLTVGTVTTLNVTKQRLIINGELEVRGKLVLGESYGADLEPLGIVNYGKLSVANDAEFRFNGGSMFFNHGQFVNDGEITASARYETKTIYTESPVQFSDQLGIDCYCRKLLSDSGVELSQTQFDYTGEAVIPALNSDAEQVRDYTIECENNVNAGTATAKITATECSRFYYGSRTFTFTVNRANIQTATENEFRNALKNPNYREITFTPKNDTSIDLEILPDVTVNLSKCNVGNLVLGKNSALNFNGGSGLSIANSSDYTALLEENAQLNVSGRSRIGNVTGSGRFNVNADGEAYFFAFADRPDGAINNNGAIYADFNLDGVTGSGQSVVRRPLSDNDCAVNDVRYTGERLSADVSFGNISEQVYSVQYKTADADEWSSAAPIERGNYRAKITFTDASKHYNGSYEFAFAVVKGIASVSNANELNAAMDSGNYDVYKIADWKITDFAEIRRGDTVIVRGRAVNYGELTVNGELKITDTGKFCNVDENSRLVIADSAAVTNEGEVYLCLEDIAKISGAKHVRERNLANAQFANIAEAVYGVNTKPSFELTYGQDVIGQDSYDFSYANNGGRTQTAAAEINVVAKVDDETYFGVAQGKYQVLGGKTAVSNNKQLYDALNNLSPDGQLCNWAVIETAGVIRLNKKVSGAPSNQKPKFHVYSGTTFVVKHEISYYDSGSFQYENFDFANDGVIELHGGAPFKDVDVWQNNGSGQVHLHAYKRSDFDVYEKISAFHYIRLYNDITAYDDDNGKLIINAASDGTVLDLDGHSVKGITGSGNYSHVELHAENGNLTVKDGKMNCNAKVVESGGNRVSFVGASFEGGGRWFV